MIKQNGGGICDHEVGTGKTLIMCVAAYEMHRLGLARKPMIIGIKANCIVTRRRLDDGMRYSNV